MRTTIIIALLGAVLLAWPPGAQAHKVNVFAYAENGKLMGEGYFPGGGKAADCQVDLLDAQGKVIAQTKTSRQGAFSFDIPRAKPPLQVILWAGEGHKAHFRLTAADLGGQGADAGTASPPPPQADQLQPARTPGAAAGAARMEKALARILDRKLAPLKSHLARLAANSDTIGVTKIVGGLGWIMGLVGIAAFFMSRRRNDR